MKFRRERAGCSGYEAVRSGPRIISSDPMAGGMIFPQETIKISKGNLLAVRLFLLLHFAHSHDFRRSTKLLVIVERLFKVDIIVL